MNQWIDLGRFRCNEALQALAEKCRQDMKRRWPKIDFDADVWEIKKLYDTKLLDVRFHTTIRDFAGKDPSYLLAFRCHLALAALEGKIKTYEHSVTALRRLSSQPIPLAELRCNHLRELEDVLVKSASPSSAKTVLKDLFRLRQIIDELGHLKVIRYLAWEPSAENTAALRKLARQNDKKKHIELLDRQIEALSDATSAMLLRDERLSAVDQSAIAVANILMCAPSRINEPLCMRVTDRYTVDDYATRPNADPGSKLYQTHLLLLMKGSKGAASSAKPVLNFMIDLSNTCWNIILELGRRSRTLVAHYEKTPDKLYLPPELEHLRGNLVSRSSLWQIANLTARQPTTRDLSQVSVRLWPAVVKCQNVATSPLIMIDNPARPDGKRKGCPKKIPTVSWQTVETYLLERVHERMEMIRRVSPLVTYDGPLSQMLMLVDSNRTLYLPQAWSTHSIRTRLKTPPERTRRKLEESVFLKLGLQMTQNGELVDCYVEPHDTRRWLTTQALAAKELE